MTKQRRIVLWRHGQTAWNLERRFQGKADVPLDEVGVAQAERSARLLAGLSPTAIMSSDLSRAAATAAALGKVTGLPVTHDRDLRERDGGEWEGLTDVEIGERFPEAHALWEPPGGETSEQVGKRVAAVLERIAEEMPEGGLVVAASHGAAIRLGIAQFLGFPQELWPALGGLSNCCWSVLMEGRYGWRLAEHNAGTLPQPVMSDDRAAGGAE